MRRRVSWPKGKRRSRRCEGSRRGPRESTQRHSNGEMSRPERMRIARLRKPEIVSGWRRSRRVRGTGCRSPFAGLAARRSAREGAARLLRGCRSRSRLHRDQGSAEDRRRRPRRLRPDDRGLGAAGCESEDARHAGAGGRTLDDLGSRGPLARAGTLTRSPPGARFRSGARPRSAPVALAPAARLGKIPDTRSYLESLEPVDRIRPTSNPR